MYYDFFGFREPPFSIAPDPRYLYLSDRHKEALAHLMHGVQGQGGFIVITGEVGTGKTTVCRCFIENAPEHVDIALILNPRLSAGNCCLRSVTSWKSTMRRKRRSSTWWMASIRTCSRLTLRAVIRF